MHAKAAHGNTGVSLVMTVIKNNNLQKSAISLDSINPITGASGLDALVNPSWAGLSPFERELMEGVTNPLHEAKLRQIRVQSIMADLMNTDEYLKEKNPEEVLEALNDILEINKDLHNNRPMLRVALRQYLESDGMDIPTLGIINDYGSKEKDRSDRERQTRESQAIQQMNETIRLKENEIARELQQSQKLDDILASLLQMNKEHKFKKEMAKDDRKSREYEGKASRKQQKEIAEMNNATTKEQGSESRKQQKEIANMNDTTARYLGASSREQQKDIADMNDTTARYLGDESRKQQKDIADMNDATTINEGVLNRENAVTIQNLRNSLRNGNQTGTADTTPVPVGGDGAGSIAGAGIPRPAGSTPGGSRLP